MLRLSKKADYALLALRHLAANAERSAVSARELAETYDIPPELLAKDAAGPAEKNPMPAPRAKMRGRRPAVM